MRPECGTFAASAQVDPGKNTKVPKAGQQRGTRRQADFREKETPNSGNIQMNRRTITGMIKLGIGVLAVAFTRLATSADPAAALHVKHVAVCAAPTAPEMARCHAHVVVDDSGEVLPFVTPSGYTPANLRSAYKVAGTGSSSTLVAIVDAFGYPNAERDLAVYRSQFGLPACTTANGCFKKVNQNGVQGSYPPANKGWSQESALDLDMVSAMCPNCSIILVEANTNGFLDLALSVNTAAAMGAHVISNSYGGGESGSSTYERYYN
jgi:hypothetical protein